MYVQICTQLTKAYVAETSFSQLIQICYVCAQDQFARFLSPPPPPSSLLFPSLCPCVSFPFLVPLPPFTPRPSLLSLPAMLHIHKCNVHQEGGEHATDNAQLIETDHHTSPANNTIHYNTVYITQSYIQYSNTLADFTCRQYSV